MNPYATAEGRAVMEVHAHYARLAREAQDARRAELHRAAVARRRNAKRGGKR